MLCGGSGRGKVWWCSGNTVVSIDKCNFNIFEHYLGKKKKVFFSVLTYCFCQRLLNKPGDCVTGRSTKPYPQGPHCCSTVRYSSVCGMPNSPLPLCMQLSGQGKSLLPGMLKTPFSSSPCSGSPCSPTHISHTPLTTSSPSHHCWLFLDHF